SALFLGGAAGGGFLERAAGGGRQDLAWRGVRGGCVGRRIVHGPHLAPTWRLRQRQWLDPREAGAQVSRVTVDPARAAALTVLKAALSRRGGLEEALNS